MKTKTATNALAVNADQQFVASEAEEIRRLLKRAAQDIVAVGQKLSAVKARLKHGEWGEYLRREFDLDERTAQRFMNVGERFKNDKLSDLNISPSVLYLLAAPSTPETAREEILDRARAGERITHSAAKGAIEIARIQKASAFDRAVAATRDACGHASERLKSDDLTIEEAGVMIQAASELANEWGEYKLRVEREIGKLLGESEGPRTLIIDPQFSTIMPRPQTEEYSMIEASILRSGVCVPLKTWRGILLDGHIRYDICHKHGIPFEVEEVDLPDRMAALGYIISMHNRANYNESQRAVIVMSLMDYCDANGLDLAAIGD